MSHHLLKEKDLKGQCVYCGSSLESSRWYSHHVGNIHYKTTTCTCGKVHTIRIEGLMSSGHDDWDGNGWVTLKEYSGVKEERGNHSLERKF